MPHSNQAKKRLRQDAVRRVSNRAIASRMKTEIKRVDRLLGEARVEEARKALPNAFKRIDKAAKKGVIHRNNAARKKSNLARRLNAAEKAS